MINVYVYMIYVYMIYVYCIYIHTYTVCVDTFTIFYNPINMHMCVCVTHVALSCPAFAWSRPSLGLGCPDNMAYIRH